MRAHEFITEVFDSPYELVTDTPATDDVKRSIRNNGDGLRGLMVYQIKDDPSNIFFLIFTDGYWEVHHVYDDGVNYSSGETLNLSISPNVKFFSTILELYMNRLNKGHRIRIVGRNPQQWNTYSAAINHIIKKHPEDYVVSEVDYNHVDLQGHKSISQTVGLRGNGWATQLNEYRKSLHNEST
jgi:hypothetical protein